MALWREKRAEILTLGVLGFIIHGQTIGLTNILWNPSACLPESRFFDSPSDKRTDIQIIGIKCLSVSVCLTRFRCGWDNDTGGRVGN